MSEVLEVYDSFGLTLEGLTARMRMTDDELVRGYLEDEIDELTYKYEEAQIAHEMCGHLPLDHPDRKSAWTAYELAQYELNYSESCLKQVVWWNTQEEELRLLAEGRGEAYVSQPSPFVAANAKRLRKDLLEEYAMAQDQRDAAVDYAIAEDSSDANNMQHE